MKKRWHLLSRTISFASFVFLAAFSQSGCSPEKSVVAERPSVAPAMDMSRAESLALDSSQVQPMYSELMAVDLPTVVQVVTAENIDIRLARYQVEASQGQYESAVGGAFPALVPTALFQRIDGRNLNSNGNFFNVGFNTFQPSIAIQWVINPGQVIYEIIAAKKRLHATEHRERAVQMETLRKAVLQFYALVFTQAHVSAAHQSVAEAEELLRINRLRSRAGAGVPADELRAEARLAERQQDLALALNALYKASIALTVTLQLEDSTVTLVPKIRSLPPIALVRSDLPIDQMLAYAIEFRPDLHSVRALIEAAEADRGSAWWSGFGPEFELGYQYGGVTGNANNIDAGEGIPSNLLVNPLAASGAFSANPVANGVIRERILRTSRRFADDRDITFTFGQRTQFDANVGARWSLSAFGDLKTADAAEKQAMLEAERKLIEVKAQVVEAAQESKIHHELISLAKQQTAAAEEALRLTEANLEAGAMTTLDVLQAQDSVAQARLRYAEAVVRYNQAEVNLLAALGLLNDQTVMIAVENAERTASVELADVYASADIRTNTPVAAQN
ncbi:MAG: TolC family protein [Phycisphaerales bacterium]|nr:TolC family protein [Phycisphaerales bacterium]